MIIKDIMLLDDNIDRAEKISQRGSKKGQNFLLVNTPEEAIRNASQQSLDLICVDLNIFEDSQIGIRDQLKTPEEALWNSATVNFAEGVRKTGYRGLLYCYSEVSSHLSSRERQILNQFYDRILEISETNFQEIFQ